MAKKKTAKKRANYGIAAHKLKQRVAELEKELAQLRALPPPTTHKFVPTLKHKPSEAIHEADYEDICEMLNADLRETHAHTMDNSLIRTLLKTARTHGYGRARQVMQQIYELWRDPNLANAFQVQREARIAELEAFQNRASYP